MNLADIPFIGAALRDNQLVERLRDAERCLARAQAHAEPCSDLWNDISETRRNILIALAPINGG